MYLGFVCRYLTMEQNGWPDALTPDTKNWITMSQSSFTLELPPEIYERVRRAAKGMKQLFEQALVNIVKAATPSLEKVPEEYRAELEAMEELGDDELWNLAQTPIPLPKQERARLGI